MAIYAVTSWVDKSRGKNDNWVYGYEAKNNKDYHSYYLEKLAWIPIVRHIPVLFTNSLDDPNLKDYWGKRNKQNESRRLSQRISKGKCDIAKSTDYKCRWCNEGITNEGLLNVQIHHIIPRRLKGEDTIRNKVYLHSECHRQVTHRGEIKPSTLAQLGVKATYYEKKARWKVTKNI